MNMGVGDNTHTYSYFNYHRESDDDSFNVVCIGADMTHKATLSFNKCPYPLYKMSFFNGSFYIINYDLWNSKIAFIRNNKILFDANFTSGQDLKFIRTYRYDIAYNQKEFFFFNKMTERVLIGKFASGFNDITFNPVLRSICTHKNGKFSIYRIFGKRVVTIAENSELLQFMLPYVVQWNGNLKYDYMIKSDLNNSAIDRYIKENNFRGHYLLMFNDVASDIQVGKMTGVIELGYGSSDDFHINDFDDGDLGTKEHLPFRRTKLKTHDEIILTQMSYTRAWRSGIRRIIFYSLDFDNEFGKLYVYKF